MNRIQHMSMNIAGCLRFSKRRKIKFIENEDGTPLSDSEARAHLNSLLAKGHKLMSCCSDCDNFDPFEHGCQGHDADEWAAKMKAKKIAELEAEVAELRGAK